MAMFTAVYTGRRIDAVTYWDGVIVVLVRNG
jgi:hypothetical protein